MTVCSTWQGWMLSVWMSLWVQVMSLVLGTCGLLLRKLLLLTLFGLLVAMPERGLILGRSTARMRVVRLGGPGVRKARKNAADGHEGRDVFMYRVSSAAPLFDLRRRFKAVMDVLDAMIRDWFSLARTVELVAQWDEILRIRAVSPVTVEDFQLAGSGGLGECRRVVGGGEEGGIFLVGFMISFTGSLFIVEVRLFVGGGTGCVRILLFVQSEAQA